MKKRIVVPRLSGLDEPGPDEGDSIHPQLVLQLELIAELAKKAFNIDAVSLSVPSTAHDCAYPTPTTSIERPTGLDVFNDGHSPHTLETTITAVEDVLATGRSDNPLLPEYPGLRSYAELIVQSSAGSHHALLHLMHTTPKRFSEDDRNRLRMFGDILQMALRGGVDFSGRDIAPSDLLQCISNMQSLLFGSANGRSAYTHALENIRSLTDSRMAFIGDVRYDSTNTPSIRLLALSDGLHRPESTALLRTIEKEGLLFNDLNNLLGEPILQKAAVSRSVGSNAKKQALPKGLPAITTYQGIPVFSGDSVVGLIGLADRPAGYTQKLAEELAPLVQMVGLLIERQRLRIENIRRERRVRRARNYDPLTGLPCGPMLTKLFRREVLKTDNTQQTLSVCVIDIDKFKNVNDDYGQELGDDLLKVVAKRLKNAVRSTDLVAKLRGDEFLVTLREGDHLDAYRRLLNVISAPIVSATQTLALSASMGVTVYPDDQSTPDILLRHASQALYIGKESGKGQIVTFDVGQHRARRERLRLLDDIEGALKRSEFELFYQPKINFRNGLIEGFEALIRWNHPERGLLMPNEFLGAIESTRYECLLGDFVIQTALAALQRFEARHQAYSISINISPYHFLNRHFIGALQSHLRGYSTQVRRRLILEVLESTALEDLNTARNTVRGCQALGVLVSLDDFGTGYSSLAYLRDLPVDELKIDKSFVMGMLDNPNDEIIVESIIDLSKRFNRRVVAEGIETKAVAQELRRLKCDFGQGYYFSEALPLGPVMRWADQFPTAPSMGSESNTSDQTPTRADVARFDTGA
ncbi:hypothetical protein RE428_49150 (plasmid) [Marinobacter nanhaiticus D15-8W]|uniref:GGDEF domain-containing protein n=1 Tax=Marinobacter nanhaiticus D15-8W TaxID=626887 RepID=N6X054_9GAMM|nr:GGDEF domain-containing protein [Marinobacter nanhaiticus]ENO17166.1 GGDEF domain-containing protein [Marinobacter nanhaiticus D15-8W]BES73897.1 hypothetical protein RE428_49150 [Marinobacter nanhaiticus D15-8W]